MANSDRQIVVQNTCLTWHSHYKYLNGDKTIYVYCTSQCAYMYTCVSIGIGSNFILGGGDKHNIQQSELHERYE